MSDKIIQMKFLINKLDEYEAMLIARKRLIEQLDACRQSPYDYAYILLEGNVVGNKSEKALMLDLPMLNLIKERLKVEVSELEVEIEKLRGKIIGE